LAAALDDLVHRGDDHLCARLLQAGTGRLEVLPLLIDLGSVVEHHQLPQRRTGQHGLDRQVEVLRAHGDDPRFALLDDRPQSRHRSVVLQRHGHQTEVGAYHVDDQVVSTGEPDRRDHISGGDRIGGVVAPGAGDRTHPVPHLAVADGLEPGLQLYRRAAGGVGHQLAGTLSKRRAIGVALDDRLVDLGEPEIGRAGRLDHLRKGSGRAELRITFVQLGHPAG
jgi:hypothetical protein